MSRFPIEQYRPQIMALCQTLPIQRLGIFGSALTEAFHEESDIDMLVIFEADQQFDHFSSYFELKERLEKIFQRPVDLMVDKPFRNPYFQQAVNENRKVIYEKRN